MNLWILILVVFGGRMLGCIRIWCMVFILILFLVFIVGIKRFTQLFVQGLMIVMVTCGSILGSPCRCFVSGLF